MIQKICSYWKSTFVRYMLSYILILIVLITCIVAYMYTHFQKTIYENTQNSQMNRLASVRFQSENQMNALVNIAERLALSDAAQPFSYRENPHMAERVMRELSTYALYYDVFDFMYVHFYGDDMLYSASSAVSAADFIGEVYDYEEASANEFAALIEKRGEIGAFKSQLVISEADEDGHNLVTFVIPMGLDHANAKGNVVFGVREERFRNIMDDEIAEGCNRYMLLNDKIIVESSTFSLNSNYIEAASAGLTETDAYEKLVAGRRYLFINMPGSIQGFSYFTAIPLNSIWKSAASGFGSFMLILLSFTLPCLGFIILISRNNYRMIRDMSAQFADVSDTYADNIDLIREGIHNLASKNRDLDTELEKSLPARKSQFANELIAGRIKDKNGLFEEAEALGLELDKRYYAVLLAGMPAGEDAEAYLEYLLKEAEERTVCVGTELLNREQLLIIVFGDDEGCIQTYAEALSRAERVRLHRMPVAVSSLHEDIADLPNAYMEAASAYDGGFVGAETCLLRFGDASYDVNGVLLQARTHIEAIRQALAVRNLESVNDRIDELKLFLKNTDMSLFAFRQIYSEVIAAIVSAAPNGGQEVLSAYDLFTLSNCRSADELDEMLRKACAEVMKETGDAGHMPLIQSILAYMMENYSNPAFTLSGVADKFELTTTRLSVEFKENVHMTPSDYLTMLRMEQAKKLLKQTDISIKDVCTQVGYSDVSSYIRKFKQYAGVTPLQYRQSARNAAEKE